MMIKKSKVVTYDVPGKTRYLCGNCRVELKYHEDDGKGRPNLYCPNCNKVIVWTT